MNWRSLSGAIIVAGLVGSVSGYLANQGAYGPVSHNYPVAYTASDFKVAAMTTSKTVYTMTAAQKLLGLCVRVSTAFAGTGISAMTCSVGSATAGSEAIYAPSLSVMQTTRTNCVGGLFSGTDLAVPDSNLDIVLYCTATGANFGDGSATVLTQGALAVTPIMVTLPAVSVSGAPGIDAGTGG